MQPTFNRPNGARSERWYSGNVRDAARDAATTVGGRATSITSRMCAWAMSYQRTCRCFALTVTGSWSHRSRFRFQHHNPRLRERTASFAHDLYSLLVPPLRFGVQVDDRLTANGHDKIVAK